MTPKFTSSEAWQQAEILMQPTFIRVIDNIRKCLESSEWDGIYQDVLVWPDNATPEDKVRVVQLQKELETAFPEELGSVKAALEKLPKPFPGYELRLSRGENHITIDLWQICYQICFSNYHPIQVSSVPVEVDTRLLKTNGEVDWHHLDEKAKGCVGAIFARLPA
ncbi:MAG: hypothetical protein AAGD25_00580 [Cyanobacteria bacterium P01_F01_bin.150]